MDHVRAESLLLEAHVTSTDVYQILNIQNVVISNFEPLNYRLKKFYGVI